MSIRLFIAIDTPQLIKHQIVEIQNGLKESGADVRWEPQEKLHATLKFLGATTEGMLPEIVSYLEGVGRTSPGFEVRYKGVGCFPNRRLPRVVWVGMEDLAGTLSLLHETIESGLVRFGFRREERAFHPHVTLGRVKSDRGIRGLLRTMESVTFESQPVRIPEILLMKSDLKPSGSVYSVLKSIPLNM